MICSFFSGHLLKFSRVISDQAEQKFSVSYESEWKFSINFTHSICQQIELSNKGKKRMERRKKQEKGNHTKRKEFLKRKNKGTCILVIQQGIFFQPAEVHLCHCQSSSFALWKSTRKSKNVRMHTNYMNCENQIGQA